MDFRVVKLLIKRYPQIREVVDLANDYNVGCEDCARLFVELVDRILKSDDLRCITFKKHYIDGKDYLTISLEEGVAHSTVHRWVEYWERRLATSLSLIRGFDVWIDHHFPEIRASK